MASVTRNASATASDHSTVIDNTYVDYGNDNDWVDLGNMAASDAAESYASASTAVPGQTYRLDLKNFGFAIPTGATINGVVVSMERRSSNTARPINEIQVRLIKAGTPVGDNKGTGTIAAEEVAVRGGATDLWGTTLSYTDVNDAGFGVALQYARNVANAVQIRVDHVFITVYYTTGGTTTTVQPSKGSITVVGYAPTIPETAGGSVSGISAALAEAYASAPSDEIIYHTLEIYHPNFSTPIRVVRDSTDLTATLESTAPRDSSSQVTFTGFSFDIVPPDVQSTGMPTCVIEIDNVSREILAQIELAMPSDELITVIYRQFLSDNLTAPENDPPLTLTMLSVEADTFRIRATCGIKDMVNKRFPSEVFTTSRFPGLVAVS